MVPLCAVAVEGPAPNRSRGFHIVGIPGIRRQARIDVEVTAEGLFFSNKKVKYVISYPRIRRLLILPADRVYEKSTYLAAISTYGVGAFLILKKHHVDAMILDYVNEGGGLMGLVVQVERGQGQRLQEELAGKGVKVDGPSVVAEETDRPGAQPRKDSQ
jgi:hypothetical protein